MTGYLADASIFVASEQRRPLGRAPGGEARISVATLTELGVGLDVWTQDDDFDVLVELAPDLWVRRA